MSNLRMRNFYVLERATGEEILVTPDIAHQYHNAIDYVVLKKPAPQDVKPDAEPPLEATRRGRAELQRRADAEAHQKKMEANIQQRIDAKAAEEAMNAEEGGGELAAVEKKVSKPKKAAKKKAG